MVSDDITVFQIYSVYKLNSAGASQQTQSFSQHRGTETLSSCVATSLTYTVNSKAKQPKRIANTASFLQRVTQAYHQTTQPSQAQPNRRRKRILTRLGEKLGADATRRMLSLSSDCSMYREDPFFGFQCSRFLYPLWGQTTSENWTFLELGRYL
ncbi:hypothetical protein V8C35DRAFT_207797 [Trichoderma chlorosporum]